MTMSLKSYSLILSCLFFSFAVYAQKHLTIDLKEVDLITFSDYNSFTFYDKIDEDKYVEVYLELDQKDNIVTYEKEIGDIEYAKTLAEIEKQNKNIININTIKKTKQSQFYNYNWSYPNKEENARINTIKLFKNGISTVQELSYGKKENVGGFGSYVNLDNDTKERWRIYAASWYSNVLLEFEKNKKILLLNDGDDIEYALFYNNKGSGTIINNGEIYESIKDKNVTKYKTTYFDDFGTFDAHHFYDVRKDKNGKSILINAMGKSILKQPADSIHFNNYFVVTKTNEEYIIYNQLQEKMPLTGIKKVYIKETGLEVLTNKGPDYYNANFEKVNKLPQINYLVCGTVNSIKFNIISDSTKKQSHSITITDGGFASQYDHIKEFILKDLTTKHNVTFLNNFKSSYWDENDDFTSGVSKTYSKYLKINKDGKIGLSTYEFDAINDTETVKDTIVDGFSKYIYYTPKAIKTKTLLPIIFDDIIHINIGNNIMFKKHSKVGIFPKHEKAIYDKFERVTETFYAFTKGNKKGWLDLLTLEEFY